MDIANYVDQLGEQARLAASTLATASTAAKNDALLAIAQALPDHGARILAANQEDVAAARAAALDAALIDRLEMSPATLATMAEGLAQVAALPDPVGEITDLRYRPSGIQVGRMRVPLGVVAIIFESRPNVTVDAAALCLKSGNAAILRGGSEALRSNLAIAACVAEGLETAGLPATSVQVVSTSDRDVVGALLAATGVVDVIVPRGGKPLVERVSREARVPVLKHLDGVCHVYIDVAADLEMAQAIAINAKTQRYGVCNAMETLLVHAAVAEAVLPPLAARLLEKGVELRGCERSRALVAQMAVARESDWVTEYLGPILAVRVVDDVQAAMDHIARYGSGHTDAIVTRDWQTARLFQRQVDSSSVMVNASTRFADGFEYGLGAEIGISTDKLHARGPVGLEGLTTQKYVVNGDGQVRT